MGFWLCSISAAAQDAAVSTATIAVESPLDYQVFQRQTRERGAIVITGRALVDCDRVEASIDARTRGASPESQDSGPPEKWEHVAYHRSSHEFHARLSSPAGGFYEVRIRAVRFGKTVGEAVVPHVGVGEVFVVSGQSNSTNYGEVRQETQTGMVTTFDGHSWRIANDPQPGVQDKSNKGSFIPAFGDAMYRKYHVPIGIASVGYGGTSVRQWLPKGGRFTSPSTVPKFVTEVKPGVWECDGALFNGMMERIRELGPHGFRALLWHQGESDANQKPGHQISGADYRRLLVKIIRQSRKQAHWSFPWFVAEVTYHTPSEPSSPEIRAAQRSVWASGIAFEGPDTDQLTAPFRQNHGAGVHFSAEGLQQHGKLWAEKVSAYLDTVLSRPGAR